MSNKSAGSFIVGLLMGGAVGTIAGLLIAPRKGRDTRQLLKKSADALPDLAEDLSTSVQLQADRLSESALRNWDGTLARLREAIAAGVEASGQERMELQQPSNETQAASNPSVPDNKL
ncbi:MAG: YtxH domain-containing protein [Symploca sp. SIO3C6]|uniref:YtxH domain-containing protein n=1 Tax=Symploca sp. SIO1C4 TaxID=2607765 RepID=A0A6B3NGF5_9CYAN|nr:YtxH domain-containing protein [Symploca sp. SIO3C6]NER28368.1 YtxH domain-containing protein [Symploca sp. SIO1C4]NET06885.1 YtxH domain-containing protein [Symploca sp. SIO2B6]